MTRPRPVACDYDADPERWVKRPPEAVAAGDVHEPVAQRLIAEGLSPVIDLGAGHGRLGRAIGNGAGYLGIEVSRAQISRCTQAVVMADARSLPIRDSAAGAIAALYMLYHLPKPVAAIREAHRVLRPGGLFVASTTSRFDSPEVQPAREPTPFDAEEAPALVAEVFGDVQVERWDAPLITLPDHESVRLYLKSRCADPALADEVQTPVTVTKRGCIVWGRKQ